MAGLKLYAIIVIIIITGCSRGSEVQLNHFDLDAATKTKLLPIRKIFSEYKIVRLESGNDFYVNASDRFWIGSEYIIAISENGVYQFNSEGIFIRKLASSGQGPKEFQNITAYGVDETNDILYFSHFGDPKHLAVIDLNTGKHLDRLSIPLENIESTGGLIIDKLMIINSKTILCLPDNRVSRSIFELFYMSTDGEFITGLKSVDSQVNISPFGGGRSYLSKFENEVHYSKANNDTIFILENGQKLPCYTFDLEDRFDHGKGMGNTIYITTETPNKILLHRTHSEILKMDGGVLLLNVDKDEQFLIDKEHKKIYSIDSILIDTLNINPRINWQLSNRFCAAVLDPIEVKEDLEQVLASSKVPSSSVEYLNNLAKQITIDDNPLLIIAELAK